MENFINACFIVLGFSITGLLAICGSAPYRTTSIQRNQRIKRIAREAIGSRVRPLDRVAQRPDFLPVIEQCADNAPEGEFVMGLTNVNPHDLLRIMREKYPGHQHYFVSAEYQFIKNPGYPHIEHAGYVYCGFVDCLNAPVAVRIFKGVSHNSLLRLISADDPEKIEDPHDCPIYQKRLQNYPPKGSLK
jgi:hypothetical protein